MKVKFYVLSGLLLLLLLGCAKSPAMTPAPTEAPPPTYTPYPTYTPIPQVTATPYPTYTPYPTPTPIPNSIAYDEPVEAVLADANEADVWAFTGHQGDVVWITMESEKMDPYVTLLAPNGDKIAYNDDTSDGSDAELLAILLEDGVYTILAGGYKPGAYQLGVSYEPNDIDAIKAEYGGGDLWYGAYVEGVFLTAEAHTWTFTGAAGHIVTIGIGSDRTKCHLTLRDPEGDEVAKIDNSAEPYAYLEAYKLKESGEYTLSIENPDGLQGYYELSLEAVLGEIRYGDEVEAQLSVNEAREQGETHQWQFTGRQGDLVVVVIESDAGASYVRLQTTDDDTLAYNSNESGTISLAAVLLEDGVYTIETGGDTAGNYQLALTLEDTEMLDTITADYSGGVLALEELVSSAFGSGFFLTSDFHIWTFNGSAGQTVTIAMDSDPEYSAMDCHLTLLDPEGSEIASDDDGGDGYNARIEIYLEESGDYILHAKNLRGTQGIYSLTLESNLLQ